MAVRINSNSTQLYDIVSYMNAKADGLSLDSKHASPTTWRQTAEPKRTAKLTTAKHNTAKHHTTSLHVIFIVFLPQSP